MTVEYFVQQMSDFRHGLRISADPRKANSKTMVDIAKAMTDEEIKASAEYFSSMKFTPWIRVVETDTVPKTRVVRGMFTALETGEKERRLAPAWQRQSFGPAHHGNPGTPR